jgi:hypothetical protein
MTKSWLYWRLDLRLLATARDRSCPLHSPTCRLCVYPPCTGRLRSRPVADASGAPVLRGQGPIGRPGTARPMQASRRTAGYLAATYGPNRRPRQHPRTPQVARDAERGPEPAEPLCSLSPNGIRPELLTLRSQSLPRLAAAKQHCHSRQRVGVSLPLSWLCSSRAYQGAARVSAASWTR